jgi:hypothetical protein
VKTIHFFIVSVVVYSLLLAYLSIALNAPEEIWLYSLLHFLTAAVLNAFLIYIVRRKSLSLIGSPAILFLISIQVYFTINAVKYFAPSAYPQFELVSSERFAGSMAGALVLFFAIGVLAALKSVNAQALSERFIHEVSLVSFLKVSVAISICTKLALIWIGYGSAYSNAAYTITGVLQIRNYWDSLLVSLALLFDNLSVLLAAIYLSKAWRLGKGLTPGHIVSVFGLLVNISWMFYIRARLPFLLFSLIFIFGIQMFSFRRALLFLQIFFVVMPMVPVLTVSAFTLLLGRVNVTGSGLISNTFEVGYRSELTDYSFALVKSAEGKGAGLAVISDALVNAIPRALWKGKDSAYQGTYYRFIDDLGWPRMDYLETPFSLGVTAFGWLGFILWPLLYLVLLIVLFRIFWSWTMRYSWACYVLLALGLLGLRVEGEWESIALNFRDFVMVSLILVILVFVWQTVKISPISKRDQKARFSA